MPNYNYKKGYDQFKYKSIVIIQYPGGNDLSESEGIITETNQYIHEFTHLSSTESGSSGGLIVLSENSEVLGIHKQGNLDKKENYGNFIGPIIDSLINNYSYEKKQIHEKIIECETNLSNNKSLGRLKYKREYIFIGELKNYEMNGKGVKYRINNNKIIKEYEGDFVEGIYEGNGKFL